MKTKKELDKESEKAKKGQKR
jgi:hypothetical protein